MNPNRRLFRGPEVYDRPVYSPEELGAVRDTDGLIRLLPPTVMSERTRILDKGLNTQELSLAVPWYILNATEDGIYKTGDQKTIYGAFTRVAECSLVASRKAIESASKNEWIEIYGNNSRPMEMRITPTGEDYVNSNPEEMDNVEFAILRYRSNLAKALLCEVRHQSNELGLKVPDELTSSEITLRGLNSQIADLRRLHSVWLQILDPEAIE